MYSWVVFVVCHFLPIHTVSHIVGSIVHAHMLCVCVQVVVRFAPPKHVPYHFSPAVCVSVIVLCVCVFKFAQTLTIVPRVALNWYTVVVLMSLSLTKLSMENKCGIYVLQNINKNSQVVPKIFFLYFWFYFRWLQVCVCVCVLLVFKICSASYAFWSVYWLSWPNTLVMQVVRVSTTDFGVMHIFNCAKLCQNMFQLRRTIKDFGKWAQIRV